MPCCPLSPPLAKSAAEKAQSRDPRSARTAPRCNRTFSDRPDQARLYDDRQDHGPARAGLARVDWLQLMDKKTTRRGNYESGSDYVLEYGELRFAFNEQDFGQRVEQAAVKLRFVNQ